MDVSQLFISQLRQRFMFPKELLGASNSDNRASSTCVRRCGGRSKRLRDFLNEYPTALREEVCDFLRDKYEIKLVKRL